MKNKFFIIITVILAVILLSSCNSTNMLSSKQLESQNLNISSIENHLAYLTSKECDGRLVGTEGNLNAQKYIIKCLTDIGIKPYEQKYEQAFNYDNVYINDISLKVNGNELKYEKDYTVSVLSNENKFEINETYNDKCKNIILSNKNENVNEESYSQAKIIISRSDELKKFAPSTSHITSQISLNVTEEIYDILEKRNDVNVGFSVNYEIKNKQENNIVGIISNDTNNASAIVLSAHFDHIGSLGENMYEGALDNASGICTLLNIAKILQEKVESNKLKKDIIVAFFNFEEGGLIGSREFAKQLSLKYNDVININFDCISEIDKNCLDTTNDNLGDLIDLDDLMEKVGISENKMRTMMSDHHNFENGINIGFADNIIHTLRDKADNISLESIARVSEGAADFALSYAYKESENLVSKENLKYETIRYEQDTLKFGEYKYIDINGEVVLIKQNTFITEDIELVKKEFEFMKIFDEFKKIHFRINFRENNEQNYITDYELGKVYKKDLNEYKNSDFFSIGFNLYGDANDSSAYFQISKFYFDTENEIYESMKNELGENIVLSNGNELYSEFNNEMGNVLRYFKEYDDFACIFTFQNITYDSEIKMVDNVEAALKVFEEKDIFNLGDKFVDLFN